MSSACSIMTSGNIDDFFWTNDISVHGPRRKELLIKHPEIRSLMVKDSTIIVKATLSVFLLLTISVLLSKYEIGLLSTFIAAYACGFISHSLVLAIHECTHYNAFGSSYPMANNLMAFFCNIPLIVPYAASFRRYHIDHHKKLAIDGSDTDLPTLIEAQIFRNSIGRIIWLLLQIIFYAGRPLIVDPKLPGINEAINFICQISFNLLLYKFFGYFPLIFLLLSFIISCGLHPMAGHFIAEHYMVKIGFETYSYYGILNLLTYNVGYHNEHHDFPNIPGAYLPKLNRIANTTYDKLPSHKSWVMAMWNFVFSENMSLFYRIKRSASKI